MKAFVGILALAAAASATHVPEHIPAPLTGKADTVAFNIMKVTPLHADMAKTITPTSDAVQTPLAREKHAAIPDEATRTLPLFGAPITARDAILDSETTGITGAFDKPVVIMFKNAKEDKIDAFLLTQGLKSLYTSPEFASIRESLLTGPAKVGLMLSAVRFLDMPELKMSLPALKMPETNTLANIFKISFEEAQKFPWVFMAEKDSLRAESLEMLTPIGEFAVSADKLKVLRDLLPLTPIPATRAALDLHHDIHDADLGLERASSLSPYRIVASPVLAPSRYERVPLHTFRTIPASSIRPYPEIRHRPIYREEEEDDFPREISRGIARPSAYRSVYYQ